MPSEQLPVEPSQSSWQSSWQPAVQVPAELAVALTQSSSQSSWLPTWQPLSQLRWQPDWQLRCRPFVLIIGRRSSGATPASELASTWRARLPPGPHSDSRQTYVIKLGNAGIRRVFITPANFTANAAANSIANSTANSTGTAPRLPTRLPTHLPNNISRAPRHCSRAHQLPQRIRVKRIQRPARESN